MVRINCRLKVRQRDEALLYQAERNNYDLGECGNILCLQMKDEEYLKGDTVEKLWSEIYEDCYLLSRYKDILLKWDRFNSFVEKILEKAEVCNRKQEAIALMEDMLLCGDKYLWIEEAGCPILLYKGEDICYNVLNIFIEQLGEAFLNAGQEVEFFDVEKEGIQGLGRLMGRHFRAVIGMQTYLFGVKMEDGSYLHDYVKGPKFNVIFDHPVWMKKHLENVPQNFRVLTHDKNYVKFIEKFYHQKAYILPPAGNEIQLEEMTQKFDISFVGSYGNYWNEVLLIHAMPRGIRFTANRFLLELRKNTDFTAEEALAEVYRKRVYQPSEEEFLAMLWELRRVYYCAMHYYRHHIVKALLDAGLQVDVFGDTWRGCPLAAYANLKCHPKTNYEESIRVWQQSKLSLNIMSWHKGGFTERMSNIMLCKTVLVTDDTEYLKGRYVPDEDMVVFHLDELEELPGKLKLLLEDKEKRERIAEKGWRKACENETWDSRAREFLRLCEE